MTLCCPVTNPLSSPPPYTIKTLMIEVAEKVSMVALGVFAFVFQPELFTGAFAIGIIYGLSSNSSQESTCAEGSGCSQGLIERLTNVRLPKVVSLIIEVAISIMHMEHHSDILSPLHGFMIGAYCGKKIAALNLFTAAE